MHRFNRYKYIKLYHKNMYIFEFKNMFSSKIQYIIVFFIFTEKKRLVKFTTCSHLNKYYSHLDLY